MPNTLAELAATANSLATKIVSQASAKGLRLAIAESLTGGALASAVVGVPGASAVLLGSIVAYDTPLKSSLLGVDAGHLARVGAVDREVAVQMAAGARSRLSMAAGVSPAVTIGVACTGVAGPDPQDGKPVGTVFIAADTPGGPKVLECNVAGDRAEIRARVVVLALELVVAALA